MTDAYEPDGIDGQVDDPTPRDLRHQLAEEKRERAELQAQLDATRRDAAFAKALGPAADEARVREYFVPGYKGELDAEQIRKAAIEAGFLQTQTQSQTRSQQTATSPGLSDAYDRIADASSGSGSPGKESWQDALAEADRITNEAERTDAILGVVEKFGGRTARQAQ